MKIVVRTESGATYTFVQVEDSWAVARRFIPEPTKRMFLDRLPMISSGNTLVLSTIVGSLWISTPAKEISVFSTSV